MPRVIHPCGGSDRLEQAQVGGWLGAFTLFDLWGEGEGRPEWPALLFSSVINDALTRNKEPASLPALFL